MSQTQIALAFILPAMFLACPEEHSQHTQLTGPLVIATTPTVYVSNAIDCYRLPTGDIWCDASPVATDTGDNRHFVNLPAPDLGSGLPAVAGANAPTVYGAPDVSCYPLPSGDQYCECSLPEPAEVPSDGAGAWAWVEGALRAARAPVWSR